MRLFLALDINQQDKGAIDAWRSEFISTNAKAVPANNFHITLSFIGQREEEDLEALVCDINDRLSSISKPQFQENITLGKEIPRNRLEEVLEVLNLKDFINYQQKGILTILDSGGRRLPRSIIQKILIARMIVSEPKLLLMEDPLQFIDEEEKKRIVDYILSDERNWTVVIVSDFYYWKKKCNRVIELGSKI